ncbi:MAG: TusE/DsrC/DsvC family sulfur relay protein [Bacteroidales bacterium]|nr:MAG: TusE/DsrC/DsvC family sulfur relay protein [Bacteroidales bacterium]
MATKTIDGHQVEVNDEGYMLNPEQWNKNIAVEIAKEEGIDLSDKHFTIIDYIREKILSGEALSLRRIGKSGVVDIKEFYQLFPGAPLKKATKIAGVPKPESCV